MQAHSPCPHSEPSAEACMCRTLSHLCHARCNAVLRQPGVLTACTPGKAPAQSQSCVYAGMWPLPHAKGLQTLQAMPTCVEAAFCLRSSLTRCCWANTLPNTEARATLCCNDASAGAAFRRLSRMVLIVSASVQNSDMLTHQSKRLNRLVCGLICS